MTQWQRFNRCGAMGHGRGGWWFLSLRVLGWLGMVGLVGLAGWVCCGSCAGHCSLRAVAVVLLSGVLPKAKPKTEQDSATVKMFTYPYAAMTHTVAHYPLWFSTKHWLAVYEPLTMINVDQPSF